MIRRALIFVFAGACSSGGTSVPFPDVGPRDAALEFDIVGFDVIRSDRGSTPRPEVLDFTDVDPLPSQPDVARMDRPCASELPGDYRFYVEGAPSAAGDRVILALPRRFRFERRIPGITTPAVCETTIPACGAADAVDVDEVSAALSDAEVVAALGGGERLFGCDTRTRGGTALVIERGAARAVLGEPCRVCAPMSCAPPPMGLQRLSDVLIALRDQELLRPGCQDVVRLDAGATTDAASPDVTASDVTASDVTASDVTARDVTDVSVNDVSVNDSD